MNSRIVRQTPNMILTRSIILLSDTWHINFILSIWFLHVSYFQMINMFSLKYTHIMLSTIESAGKWSSLPYIHVNNRLETFNWKMSLIFPLEKWTYFLWRFLLQFVAAHIIFDDAMETTECMEGMTKTRKPNKFVEQLIEIIPEAVV